MDRSSGDERPLLVSTHGVPSIVRDNREPFHKQIAVYLILASTLFERIAFYSIAATLSVAVDPDRCPYESGPVVTLIFIGASYFCTLFFAIISDQWLGRAKTILLGYTLYLSGYILMTIFTSGSIDACQNTKTVELFTHSCKNYLYPVLILTAIGAGAVQCNVSVFGAEQLQDIPDISRYFDRYVLALNIGAIFAKFSFYFAQPDQTQYYLAFVYGVSTLAISFLLFLSGFRYYLHMKNTKTTVTQCMPVLINALQNWYERRRDKSINDNIEESLEISRQEKRTFLDYAKIENRGKFLERTVDEVKSLRDALVVFGLLIPYWLIYDQLNSTFRLQAKHMTGTDVGPMIAVSLVDPVVLITGILVINIFIYRLIDAEKRLLSITMKFIIGMCIAIVTMIIAGSIENVRQTNWQLNNTVSNLSIYAEFPQVFSMGASELFIMVASFEYAYFAAPRSAQTFFMSLRFCSVGVSSLFGASYISLYKQDSVALDFTCHTGEDHQWRFPVYFFVLGAIQFIFLLIFIGCQKRYKLIQLNRQQINVTRFFQH